MDGKRVRVGACLFVGDMDRMARFYRDVLGLHTDWEFSYLYFYNEKLIPKVNVRGAGDKDSGSQ